MKKLNTWTAVLILISIMLYATFAWGKQNKGVCNQPSISGRSAGAPDSGLHSDNFHHDQNKNKTNKAGFNKNQTINTKLILLPDAGFGDNN